MRVIIINMTWLLNKTKANGKNCNSNDENVGGFDHDSNGSNGNIAVLNKANVNIKNMNMNKAKVNVKSCKGDKRYYNGKIGSNLVNFKAKAKVKVNVKNGTGKNSSNGNKTNSKTFDETKANGKY